MNSLPNEPYLVEILRGYPAQLFDFLLFAAGGEAGVGRGQASLPSAQVNPLLEVEVGGQEVLVGVLSFPGASILLYIITHEQLQNVFFLMSTRRLPLKQVYVY